MTKTIQYVDRDDVAALRDESILAELREQIISLQTQLAELLEPTPSESESMKSTSRSTSLG